MSVEVVERVVRTMMVAMMNGMLYFPKHLRVVEATEETEAALSDYFSLHEYLQLSVNDEMIVFEERPLYDLSIYANRLIRAMQKCGARGLRLDAGVTSEEIRNLVELFLEPIKSTAEESNAQLAAKGVTRIVLEENAVKDKLSLAAEEASTLNAINDQPIQREIYVNAVNTLQEIMVEIHRKKRVSFTAAHEIAENLTHTLRKNRKSFLAFTAVKYYDAYTFNHSVNVCILATNLAEQLCTNVDDLVHIAQAGLLHDVGKLLVPPQLLEKQGRLNAEEWEIMRNHTSMGAKILMESEGAQDLAINVAYGHHLTYDNKGYPERSHDFPLDPVTELIHVVDSYEAIMAKRPYKVPYPPELAAELLMKEAGTSFHPVWVETFLRHNGIFPLWTQVLLDDGFQARVISENPDEPFRPMVQLTHEPDGRAVDGHHVVDTSEADEAGNFHISVIKSLTTDLSDLWPDLVSETKPDEEADETFQAAAQKKIQDLSPA